MTVAAPDPIADLWREQARDLRRLAAIQRALPLSCRILWTNPTAVCDQRRAVIGAMTNDVAVVLGGWRSGKSEGVKQLNAASAMGGDHPAVRRWLSINDLPYDSIPDGPAQTYMIAQSSNDSLKYHRDDFDRMIGPWGTWYNRNGKGEALLTIARPGSKALGKVWFKSVDQGRRAFQGISIRRGDIDEEPLGLDGFGVFDELRARVADQGGKIAIMMVPMEGITWVHDRLVIAGEYGARHFTLDPAHNPHLPPNFLRLFEGMSDDDIAVRRFGQFKSRSGAVYKQWAQGDGDRYGPGHVCNDFDIPDDWPRFRGADFGLVNATVVLWGALDPDDTLFIYREYFQPDGESYPWHGEQVRALEPKGEVFQASWGDPSAAEALDFWAGLDLYFDLANNDREHGIDAVKDRLRLRGDNRPRLKVFRSCPNLIREFGSYAIDPKRIDHMPLKKDDHAMDALRYMCMGLIEYKGL